MYSGIIKTPYFGTILYNWLYLASATLSTCHHKSRANRGKTAGLIGDTDDWKLDGKSQHMAKTTSSALYASQRCQPPGIRTQDRSSAADPVSSEHPPTVVCVWDNDSDSIVHN
ncbi:hypothetical protein ACOMHN_066515 [Nucella lapillus]